MSQQTSRRQFLQRAAAAGLTAAAWSRVYGANERLNLASVGVGGKGWSDLTETAASPHVTVVALCDVDESAAHLGRAAEKFPKARRFTDWRRLMDQAKDFDAVTVSVPDHMHAPVALAAMHRGKHVFCQKPLTHTVHEARQMQRAAAKYKLVTQMGNQIQSHPFYRTAVQVVHDGVIGKVKEVHAWQCGQMQWLLADDRPDGTDPVPTTLHWEEWLGVAPPRPYKERLYHSFNWRAWQDFSNGQLGDFGCHILDPIFLALGLTAPMAVRAETPSMNCEVWPRWAVVRYEFPGTERTAGSVLRLTWYDGEDHFPPRAALGLPEKFTLPTNGSVLIGEKGSLLIPHVGHPKLFPEKQFADFKYPNPGERNHYTSWADACRGADKTTSPFSYGGRLTEAVLLGTIAYRLPGSTLTWDAAAMQLSGHKSAAAMLTKSYRKGWEPTWVA